jgi:hypothetical protein
MLFAYLLLSASAQAQTRFQTVGSPNPDQQLYQEDASGNIGIGTVKPLSNLHVSSFGNSGTTWNGGVGQNNDATANAVAQIDNNSGTLNGRSSTIGVTNYLYNSLIVNRINTVSFLSGSTSASTVTDFVVTGSGYTGIGLAAPTTMLHVYSPMSGNTDLLQVANDNGPALYVTASGLTGINTSTPGYELDVNGSANVASNLITAKFQMTSGANNGYIIQGDASGNAKWVSPQSIIPAGLWSISGSNIYNTSLTGKVGIGTATPAYTIDVNGNSRFSNTMRAESGIDLVNATGTGWSNTISFKDGAGNERHLITDQFHAGSDAGHLLIIPGGFPYPGTGGGVHQVDLWGTLSVTDKVVIGGVPTVSTTAAPNLGTDYSLYVAKGVIAEKFKCALSTGTDWSDYVFDKDYKLATLSDVEAFIKENKHLPGVPSADDVVCDGIDMAKMDATLLKKIEELTLYMLELKKDNENMKAQINNLKK